MSTNSRWRSERGGATLILIMVLLLVAALVGAMAVRAASSDLQMASGQRLARSSFYCAEAGLADARGWFSSHYSSWNTIFAGGAVVGYPVTGDLDNDGAIDYRVTLRDNVDEFPVNDPTHDNDLTAIMESTCVNPRFGSTTDGGTRTLDAIINFTGNAGTDYRYQAGHSSTHSGNAN